MSTGYINVTVVGALGRDPEVKSTPTGKKVANFSVAVDQGYGDSKKTEWVNIVVWEKLAELTEKYLKKGKVVALSGTLQTRSWDKDGVKQYRTEVVARDITFLDGGSIKSEGNSGRASAPATRQQTAPAVRAAAPEADPFGEEEPF